MRDFDSDVIRSSQNNLIKRVRSLGLRKHRDAERAFVVEGARGIATALDYGVHPEVVLVTDDARTDIVDLARSSDSVVRVVDRSVFDAAMDTATPQGIAAVFTKPATVLPMVPEPFLLLLDRVGDPGNLGTLIRSAAGAGCDAVVIGPGSADPWSAKAARSSMGSIFAIPVVPASDQIDALVSDRCAQRWLAAGDATIDYSTATWTGGVAIIVGSEGHGAGNWGHALCTGSVSISLAGGVESLNAAVAGSILLFEARRQRNG